MGVSTMMRTRWALCVAAVAVLGGCGLIPVIVDRQPSATQAAPDAGQGWIGRSTIGFDMELPAGWNDLTDQYRRELPDTVLAAVFGMGSTLDVEGEPFVTISTDHLGMDQYPRHEVYQDLDSWAKDMADPVRGAEGGIQTDAGAAGWWGTVTGEIHGRVTIIHAVHIFQGRYELMALIESYEGDDADATALLDALRTFEFTVPAKVEGRHGAPVADDGRWHSYCGTFSAAANPALAYDFVPSMDSKQWKCPEDTDYLGGWVDTSGGSQVNIHAQSRQGLTVAEARAEDSIPASVGETVTTPHKYEFTLMSEDAVAADDGGTMTRLTIFVVTPDGREVTEVGYFVSLGEEGTAVVLASEEDGVPGFDETAMRALAASIRADG